MVTLKQRPTTTQTNIAQTEKEEKLAGAPTELVTFFGMAYLITWIIVGLKIFTDIKIPGFFALAGPTIAALVVIGFSSGLTGYRELGKRLIRLRFGLKWYALALLITPAISLTAYIMGKTFNLGDIPAESDLVLVLPMLLGNFALFFFTEEIGWRGYALPKLQKMFNPLVSSLVLGILWGLWHLPYWFVPGSFQAGLPFAGFMLLTVSQAVLMTWLYNNSRDSVLLAVLFHAAADTAFAFSGVLSGPQTLFWLVVGLQWLVTLGVIAYTKGGLHIRAAR
ncbi:MAG: CPBP family intramembrane metalloprotease [Chloroflexi bacterium]|nr:CPBP family intramembrane metalloprotease [Chloroflexota bacterium]OJV92140.1 MAG: hypothetical protein BGO39_09475 [Chloroflexi bacterium 54-19]